MGDQRLPHSWELRRFGDERTWDCTRCSRVVFVRDRLQNCIHCEMPPSSHSKSGNCMYGPTTYMNGADNGCTL